MSGLMSSFNRLSFPLLKLDFWRGPSYLDKEVDVMVPPHLNQTFDFIFQQRSLDKTVLIEDVQK